MGNPVLELRGVDRIYNKGKSSEVSVLNGANISVQPGELVALVAPSGAGKSTLLHIAGLLDRPDSGSVLVNGQDTGALTERARTKIRRDQLGFVYQFHHLLPEFSARENIILPQLAHGIAKPAAGARADALLDKVGLAARADHRPAALSGGEQQRVAFCRALANQPAVLLADEPTGNLDPDTAETVFSLMLELARDTGLSGVVATHNPELAARMDRVIRLEAGSLTAL